MARSKPVWSSASTHLYKLYLNIFCQVEFIEVKKQQKKCKLVITGVVSICIRIKTSHFFSVYKNRECLCCGRMPKRIFNNNTIQLESFQIYRSTLSSQSDNIKVNILTCLKYSFGMSPLGMLLILIFFDNVSKMKCICLAVCVYWCV